MNNKKFNIQFSENQLEVLSAALCELPYKHSAPIIAHIQQQIQRQFDIAKGDDPTGQEKPKDEFAGD